MSDLKHNSNVEEQNSDAPKLCVKCFQFFGTKDTSYLCSKCFKETLNTDVKKEASPIKKIENTGQISKPVAAEEEEMIKSEDDSTNTKVTEKEEPKKAKQEDKNKCFTCNKKVGIYGF